MSMFDILSYDSMALLIVGIYMVYLAVEATIVEFGHFGPAQGVQKVWR